MFRGRAPGRLPLDAFLSRALQLLLPQALLFPLQHIDCPFVLLLVLALEQGLLLRPDPDQFLTVADVGAHESTVRGWIRRGELKAARFSTRIGHRIRHANGDALLRRRMLTTAISRQLLLATSNTDSVP